MPNQAAADGVSDLVLDFFDTHGITGVGIEDVDELAKAIVTHMEMVDEYSSYGRPSASELARTQLQTRHDSAMRDAKSARDAVIRDLIDMVQRYRSKLGLMYLSADELGKIYD